MSRVEQTAAQTSLHAWFGQIAKHQDSLIESAASDVGRTSAETKWLEWAQVESALRFLARAGRVFQPQTVSTSYPFVMGRRQIKTRRIAMGRVLIVGTWNFPLGLHLPQILFALAAGNTVVFKPSPFAPRSADALADALKQCEKFSLWRPTNQECLDEVKRGSFDLVVFTGGNAAAKIFAQACAESLTPLIAEASGVESALITVEGGRQFAQHVDHLLWGIFHNSGQTCIAPRFVFVHSTQLAPTFRLAVKALEECPADIVATRPPARNAQVRQEHEAFETWVRTMGAQAEHRFSRRPEFSLFQVASLTQLSTYPPATFGPSLIFVGYDELATVVSWLNASPWSLMTSVFGKASSAEECALMKITSSVVTLNETVVAAGDAAVSLGGRGSSGYGVCRGVEGLHQMSRVQTWVEVKPWFGIRQTLIRPGLQTIEKLNYLNSFELIKSSGAREVENAD